MENLVKNYFELADYLLENSRGKHIIILKDNSETILDYDPEYNTYDTIDNESKIIQFNSAKSIPYQNKRLKLKSLLESECTIYICYRPIDALFNQGEIYRITSEEKLKPLKRFEQYKVGIKIYEALYMKFDSYNLGCSIFVEKEDRRG